MRGGSHPIRRDRFLDRVGYIRSLASSEGEKATSLGGNARRLFKPS